MKSKKSSTIDINWNSPLSVLIAGKKPSLTIEKIASAGVESLIDLLWILPLRLFRMPLVQSFKEANLNQYFKGTGKVLHVEIKPAFGRRGKGKILLYNGQIILRDTISSETISLRWFNLYPNQKKQLESLEEITFLGQVQEFRSQIQIINPQIIDPNATSEKFIIEYPTINKVSGNQIKKLIQLIPQSLWSDLPDIIPELSRNSKMSLNKAFKVMHGLVSPAEFSDELKSLAEKRLVYEEFLRDQLKIITRRKYIKRKSAPIIECSQNVSDNLANCLPFELTSDQLKVFQDIMIDFKSGHPMMRMIQGDVGCGKTIVAFLASRVVNQSGYQVALMCPTEALAQQHYITFKELNPSINIELLLGSTKVKEKKIILNNLLTGQTEIVIGTHSLFQDSVQFKNLGLAIIDEQHKFGVEQRLKLVNKGNGTHSLIMTATPIPRTLSLAQYGDLDISSIKTMPSGRKTIKTRITERSNYLKYIEFVKARIKLGEQAYFVFPAIEETEIADIQNVKESFIKYKEVFCDLKVDMLHGQMKPEEKEQTISNFRLNKTQILISTSVIEVGINISNATIMSIYNPERFGLSSLHQLRGRVGRGEKPGFCFLVLDRELSLEGQQRLKVIEDNLDGFIIAEQDLKFRGEGDIFGLDQSGNNSTKKLANYITHSAILEEVVSDLKRLQASTPELILPHLEKLAKDQKILDTI